MVCSTVFHGIYLCLGWDILYEYVVTTTEVEIVAGI